MITGDYHHTAVAVAKDVGMVKPDSQVVVIDTARHELQHDPPVPGTPDSGSSNESYPQATPQVSFDSRTADFTHGFFGTPHEERSRVGRALPRDVSQANKGLLWKQLPCTSEFERESSQRSLSAGSPEGPKLQPGVKEGADAKLSGVLAPEATPGKRVSFGGPRLPIDLPKSALEVPRLSSESARRQLSDTPLTVRLAQIKLAPLSRQPSKSASDSSPSPTNGKVPFKRSLSPAHQSPSRLSFEGLPPTRQLSKVSSLTRLPSQAASVLTASPPETSATSQDDSFQLSDMHKRVQSLSKQVSQGVGSNLVSTFQTYSGGSTPLHLLRTPSECGARGLTFTSGAGRQHVDPRDALTAMAKGTMQCAVTGEAFETLLQLKEVSLLETVMRNVVVFSRMQPHQKGQVMDLLGCRGIHQPSQGNPRHIQVESSLFLLNNYMYNNLNNNIII